MEDEVIELSKETENREHEAMNVGRNGSLSDRKWTAFTEWPSFTKEP